MSAGPRGALSGGSETGRAGRLAALVLGLAVLAAAPGPAAAGEIHDAADAGDLARLRDLVARDSAAVRETDEYGATALHYAASRNRVEVVKLLLDAGAAIDARDQLGMTPLHLATVGATGQTVDRRAGDPDDWVMLIELENVETVDLLLARGADVNARDANALSALHMAAEKARGEIAARLIARGAQLEARDSYGFTPLMVAAYYLRIQWVEQRGTWSKFVQGDNIAVAQALVDAGADVNAQDPQGVSALFLAAIEGHEAVVRLLLEHGADVNRPDDSGSTPLHAAAEGARLLEVEVEGEDQSFAYAENIAVATVLLEAGALANARDDQGRTPLALALERDADEIALLLRRYGGIE